MGSELPTILTMLGIGLALGGLIFTLYRLQQREMDQRVAEFNRRIDVLETQGRATAQDIAEVKGALGVIRDAVPLRVGEPPA